MKAEEKLDQIIAKEPIVLALSLDKKRQHEHIIFGPRSQVYSYLAGLTNVKLLYNDTRPLGTFLFEHEAQSAGDWNAYVHTPLSNALHSFAGRTEAFNSAMEYLEPKLNSNDAVCKFTSSISRSLYDKLLTILGSDDKRTEYLKTAANFSRSFKQQILGNEKNSTIAQAEKRIQKAMELNGLRADTTAQIWYPSHLRNNEWILISESFYPAILYYLRRLNDWGMCFCRCSNCGNHFIADSLHHSLCSDKCRQARNRQNKQEFDERARQNGYDIEYKNATQRMRNSLNRLKKQDNATESQIQKAESMLRSIRKDAIRQKKTIRTEADHRAFRNWLFVQEQQFDQACSNHTL